jgi:type I restriction enzyme, S subunit
MINPGWRKWRVAELAAPERWALNGGPFGSKLVSNMYTTTGVPVIRGCNLPSEARFDETDFVFVSEQKADELRQHSAKPGDLIITQRGTLGQVGLIPHNSRWPRYIVSQSQMKLTVDGEKANTLFLYYVFRSPMMAKRIEDLALRSGVPHINLSMLRTFEVDLPSLESQKRIASILGTYDDLIEVNRRRIALLEEMGKRLFEEWFVRFRYPGDEDYAIVETPDGPLPQGWRRETLANMCASIDYGYTASSQVSGGPKFLRITDIAATSINWATVPHCQIEAERLDKYLLHEGDIVVARTGATVGYAKRLNKHHPDTVFASYLVRFRPKPEVSNLLLGIFVQSEAYKAYVRSNAGGAAQPNANAKILGGVLLPFPPEKLQSAFQAKLEPIFDLAELLLLQNAKLSASRDLLLPRLISGELAIVAAEQELEAVA